MLAGVQRFGFVGTMKDVLRDNEAGMGPMSGLALLTACVLAVAISYNALFSQPSGNGRKLMASRDGKSLSTRITVDAGSTGSTVLLRYDPAVEEVQRGLLATGDYKGMVDGVAGKQTRLAIENYQRRQGLPVNGEISSELVDHIRFTQTVSKAAEFTGSVDEPETEVEAAQVRNVQATLAELGYQPGEVSGEMNATTEAAIRQFQTDHRLNADGVISVALITELARQSGDPAPSTE